jgi:hypothetical protein
MWKVCLQLVYFVHKISVKLCVKFVSNYIYTIVVMGLCYSYCVYNSVMNCV